MNTTDCEIKIEGEPGPRYRIFDCDRDGHPHECVFETNQLAELDGFSRRADKRYMWRIDGRFMNKSEFESWKAKNS